MKHFFAALIVFCLLPSLLFASVDKAPAQDLASKQVRPQIEQPMPSPIKIQVAKDSSSSYSASARIKSMFENVSLIFAIAKNGGSQNLPAAPTAANVDKQAAAKLREVAMSNGALWATQSSIVPNAFEIGVRKEDAAMFEDSLRTSGYFSRVYASAPAFPSLTESVPYVNAPAAWANGSLGADAPPVFVLDTGFDYGNPAFSSRITGYIGTLSSDEALTSMHAQPWTSWPVKIPIDYVGGTEFFSTLYSINTAGYSFDSENFTGPDLDLYITDEAGHVVGRSERSGIFPLVERIDLGRNLPSGRYYALINNSNGLLYYGGDSSVRSLTAQEYGLNGSRYKGGLQYGFVSSSKPFYIEGSVINETTDRDYMLSIGARDSINGIWKLGTFQYVDGNYSFVLFDRLNTSERTDAISWFGYDSIQIDFNHDGTFFGDEPATMSESESPPLDYQRCPSMQGFIFPDLSRYCVNLFTHYYNETAYHYNGTGYSLLHYSSGDYSRYNGQKIILSAQMCGGEFVQSKGQSGYVPYPEPLLYSAMDPYDYYNHGTQSLAAIGSSAEGIPNGLNGVAPQSTFVLSKLSPRCSNVGWCSGGIMTDSLSCTQTEWGSADTSAQWISNAASYYGAKIAYSPFTSFESWGFNCTPALDEYGNPNMAKVLNDTFADYPDYTVVMPAGNAMNDELYTHYRNESRFPSCMPQIITAGASGLDGRPTNYTAYWTSSNRVTKPDLAAPGGQANPYPVPDGIYNVSFSYPAGIQTQEPKMQGRFTGYAYPAQAGTDVYSRRAAGTSIAAAHVAGAVALMLDANPLLTRNDVRAILLRTARPPASEYPGVEALGAGILDVGAAVEMARSWPLENSTPQLINHEIVSNVTLPLSDGRTAAVPAGLRLSYPGTSILFRAFTYPPDTDEVWDPEEIRCNDLYYNVLNGSYYLCTSPGSGSYVRVARPEDGVLRIRNAANATLNFSEYWEETLDFGISAEVAQEGVQLRSTHSHFAGTKLYFGRLHIFNGQQLAFTTMQNRISSQYFSWADSYEPQNACELYGYDTSLNLSQTASFGDYNVTYADYGSQQDSPQMLFLLDMPSSSEYLSGYNLVWQNQSSGYFVGINTCKQANEAAETVHVNLYNGTSPFPLSLCAPPSQPPGGNLSGGALSAPATIGTQDYLLRFSTVIDDGNSRQSIISLLNSSGGRLSRDSLGSQTEDVRLGSRGTRDFYFFGANKGATVLSCWNFKSGTGRPDFAKLYLYTYPLNRREATYNFSYLDTINVVAGYENGTPIINQTTIGYSIILDSPNGADDEFRAYSEVLGRTAGCNKLVVDAQTGQFYLCTSPQDRDAFVPVSNSNDGGVFSFSPVSNFWLSNELSNVSGILFSHPQPVQLRFFTQQYSGITGQSAMLVLDGSGTQTFYQTSTSSWQYVRTISRYVPPPEPSPPIQPAPLPDSAIITSGIDAKTGTGDAAVKATPAIQPKEDAMQIEEAASAEPTPIGTTLPAATASPLEKNETNQTAASTQSAADSATKSTGTNTDAKRLVTQPSIKDAACLSLQNGKPRYDSAYFVGLLSCSYLRAGNFYASIIPSAGWQ